MLYDLNISWSPSAPTSDLERTLKFSASLGYNVVALNHTIGHPIPSQIVNPIPLLGSPSPHHPQPRDARARKDEDGKANGSSLLPTVLRRATVTIADPAISHRLPAIAAAYDILAVRPTTEKAFLAACTSISEASLISLDLTAHHSFHFRPKPCMAAVRRGLRFELCYAAGTAAVDARARAAFIGNATAVVRATRGRGIVVSSGASGALGLRAPADVVNLLAVWGLGPERGAEALGAGARAVVVNEGIKRRSFRGVVDVLRGAGPVAEEQPTVVQEGGGRSGENESREGTAGKADKKGQKQKPSDRAGKNGELKTTQAVKRKDVGDADLDGTNGDTGGPPLSKRQAKKMKLAALKAKADDPT